MRTKCRVASAVCAALFAMAIGVRAQADDAKCQDGVAKGSRNVGNQEQKKNRKCVKDGAGDVDSCVDTESPKAAIKRTKLVDLFASGGKCDPVPALGVNSDPNAIADGTEEASGDILRGAFGDPVDGIEAGSKCHDKIAKRAGKKFDTELKAFRGCIKDAAPVASQAAVDACIAAGVNDAKAQSTVQPKLLADMEGQCTFASPPAGLEDGDCSACTDAASCAACIGDIVDCQACLAMNNSSNGTADCDLLNDGVDDDDCGVAPTCPLAAGEYTNTQTAGGTLRVSGLAPFPFPAGGTIVQDTAAGTYPACVHDTVVPFPGGFSAPVFCIPALVFTVSVEQTGCGIGQIDSNGGSSYDVTEVGDTSSATCGLTQACVNGTDSDIRVDVTVGPTGGCTGPGSAQAIVSIPVQTTTWQDVVFSCPDGDGVYDPGTDALITSFPQILDFTTDDSSADFAELPGDADGCCIAGSGPATNLNPCTPGGAGPQTASGNCIDLTGLDLAGPDTTTVATGSIGSAGSPLFDLSFRTILPNEVSTTGAFAGAVCGSPPDIDFAGTATRCIDAP